MANLNSLDQESIEKDYNIVQPAEEPDKLDNGSVTDILLVLFAIIPMIILIILFSL